MQVERIFFRIYCRVPSGIIVMTLSTKGITGNTYPLVYISKHMASEAGGIKVYRICT